MPGFSMQEEKRQANEDNIMDEEMSVGKKAKKYTTKLDINSSQTGDTVIPEPKSIRLWGFCQ